MEKTSCLSVTPESYDHALYERFQAPIVPCWEGDPVYIDPEPSEPPLWFSIAVAFLAAAGVGCAVWMAVWLLSLHKGGA